MSAAPTILVVDDTPANLRLLEAVLVPRGYTVLLAESGADALDLVARQAPDLVLLDILMPGVDGYEVCRRLRQNPATEALPVVMITSSGNQEKLRALEEGADDFIAKPFDKAELLARVRSLLRVKHYQDVIQSQAAELKELNRDLESRVAEQVKELERLERLRRFLSPQIARVVVSSSDQNLLESHRRDVAVVFCDLRGFTAFSEVAEPEEVMNVLRDFHSTIGALITRFEATVGFFAGDGLMVFFNDPVPCDNPAERAVRLAVAMRERTGELTTHWRRLGHALDFGVGIAYGYATLGEVGFESRYDYAVIGNVANLAARLCDAAAGGQILVAARVRAAVEDLVETQAMGELVLKGFHNPLPAFNIVSLRKATSTDRSASGHDGGRTLGERARSPSHADDAGDR